jgi:phosphonate transport system substrate-binding protein
MSALRGIPLCAALLGLVLSIGCGVRDLDAVGAADTPLVLLLSPAHGAGPQELESLTAALAEASGLNIEIVVAPSPQAAVTRIGTSTWDVAMLELFDYLFCHQEYGVEAGLQVLRHGAERSHRGELLVRAEGGAAELSGLQGKPVAFVTRYSTSGFLFPAALLAEAGVVPEPLFAGSHEAAVVELRAGRADAAAVYSGLAAADPGLRVLATTQPIPNEPVFFRRGLTPETRLRLARGFQDVARSSRGAALLGPLADITGFVEADDATWRDVHQAIEAAGNSVEDLVPQGWRLRHESHRSLLGDFAL